MKTPPPPSPIPPKKIFCFLLFLAFLSWYLVEFVSGISRQDAFTWMDPYQYYAFARDFASGIRAWDQFELPSIFPFFVVPFLKVSPTIPSALCANVVFLAMLLSAGYFLCAEFDIGKWYYVMVISFLCSPLIIGLSHSLYPELALSALVAWQFVLWFRSDHFRNPWATIVFVWYSASGSWSNPPIRFFSSVLFSSKRRRSSEKETCAVC
jgi:hypothetical protein